jgi:hypothetical protein
MTMHRQLFASEPLLVLRRVHADTVPTVEMLAATAREQ